MKLQARPSFTVFYSLADISSLHVGPKHSPYVQRAQTSTSAANDLHMHLFCEADLGSQWFDV